MDNIHIFVIIIIVILVSWWGYKINYTTSNHTTSNHTTSNHTTSNHTTICAKCNINDDLITIKKVKNQTDKVLKPILKKNKKSKSRNKAKKVVKRNIADRIEPKSDEKLAHLNITINKKLIGTIIIKLFTDIVPLTCKNFMNICDNRRELSYNGTKFHRIIKDFMIQGGDIEGLGGKGGKSIYGKTFDDENFILRHDRPYLLSMANHGPDTNGSQFFITTNPAEHLDGKHVVFGEIVLGHAIVDKLNNIETSSNDVPLVDCCIDQCYVDM
jgi:cyclophilin family peptidyl-prolyl cis-trans isomerase